LGGGDPPIPAPRSKRRGGVFLDLIRASVDSVAMTPLPPFRRAVGAACALALLAACAAPPPPAQAVPLRVLSYNIKRGLGNDGVTDIARAAALINRLQPDLVALQELDNGCERSGRVDQMARLAELTGMQGRFGEFMPYQGGQYGIGLLSRFPILSSHNHPLPDGAEPRTALDADVELPDGRRLTFCSVHFYRTEAERLAQARRVIEIFERTAHPMILAGDFNSRPGGVVMTEIEKHWVNPDKGDDPMTFSATEPTHEIDYILYRPEDGFAVERVDVLDEPVVSDHRPVWMELTLRAPQ